MNDTWLTTNAWDAVETVAGLVFVYFAFFRKKRDD
jgi:hypothetical protein